MSLPGFAGRRDCCEIFTTKKKEGYFPIFPYHFVHLVILNEENPDISCQILLAPKSKATRQKI